MRPDASMILMSAAASGVDCCVTTEPSIAPACDGWAIANECCKRNSTAAVQLRLVDTVAASYCTWSVLGPSSLTHTVRDEGPRTEDGPRTKHQELRTSAS